MTTDYRGKWVKKPWGKERQLIETADRSVAVWHLHLDPGQSTSMHMHSKKKTALVVLGGDALVKFMSGTMHPKVGEKVRFAPGQYHQTLSGQHAPLDLLEVETPSDKQDLVRLEDQYGRAGKGYEGAEALEEDAHAIPDFDEGREIGSCSLRIARNCELNLISGIAIFLSGGVRRGSMPVLSPGDVVEAETLRRLASKYELLESEVLEVSRA